MAPKARIEFVPRSRAEPGNGVGLGGKSVGQSAARSRRAAGEMVKRSVPPAECNSPATMHAHAQPEREGQKALPFPCLLQKLD